VTLRAGDWVEVRSKEEILQSLDSDGKLENLPFMPQMFKYCGGRFRVQQRAHKTCDTVSGTGGRALPHGIHLQNIRCDGRAYGGCQAACLIFWKEAWLKPIKNDGPSLAAKDAIPGQPIASPEKLTCSESIVIARTLAKDQPASGERKYSCQAVELPNFTSLLPWWDVRQYIEDYTSGNVTIGRILGGFVYAGYYPLGRPGRNPLRIPFRWLYDHVVGLWDGVPFPRRSGVIPLDQPTPVANLALQPGELVRVKSFAEIRKTLNRHGRNRGLYFDAEMVPYCGRVFRVKSRISNFINEKTGVLVTLKTPAVALENVWCQSRYSDKRMFCPRGIYSWWREVWLERASEETAGPDDGVAEVLLREQDCRQAAAQSVVA
jgi:hypothetical protein